MRPNLINQKCPLTCLNAHALQEATPEGDQGRRPGSLDNPFNLIVVFQVRGCLARTGLLAKTKQFEATYLVQTVTFGLAWIRQTNKSESARWLAVVAWLWHMFGFAGEQEQL